jgi:hypothetical protein
LRCDNEAESLQLGKSDGLCRVELSLGYGLHSTPQDLDGVAGEIHDHRHQCRLIGADLDADAGQ